MRNRIDIRISPDEHELLKKAAEVANMSVTDFLLQAAAEKGSYERPDKLKTISKSFNWLDGFVIKGETEARIAASRAPEDMTWEDFQDKELKGMRLTKTIKQEIFSAINIHRNHKKII